MGILRRPCALWSFSGIIYEKRRLRFSVATLFTFFRLSLLFFRVTAAAGAAFAAAASDLNAVKLAIFAAAIVSATRYVAMN